MNRPAILALALAAAAAASAGSPAHADTGRSLRPGAVATARVALDGSTACVRAAASDGCGAYQVQLLRAVGAKAAAQARPISVNDLGRAQLNALIASIN